MKACGRLNVCALLLYCGLKRTVQGKSRIAGGAVSGLRHPPTFRIGGDHVNPIQIEIIQISRSGRFPPCGAARAWLCVDMDVCGPFDHQSFPLSLDALDSISVVIGALECTDPKFEVRDTCQGRTPGVDVPLSSLSVRLRVD